MLRTLSGAGWDELQLFVVEKLKVVMTAWSWASRTSSALTGAQVGGEVCVWPGGRPEILMLFWDFCLFVCFLTALECEEVQTSICVSF